MDALVSVLSFVAGLSLGLSLLLLGRWQGRRDAR